MQNIAQNLLKKIERKVILYYNEGYKQKPV
jgi:hypothetical protein